MSSYCKNIILFDEKGDSFFLITAVKRNRSISGNNVNKIIIGGTLNVLNYI
jgi:hypothetical protein